MADNKFEYIDDEESEQGGPGYPRNCSGCENEN